MRPRPWWATNRPCLIRKDYETKRAPLIFDEALLV
jgi:hypothetical protein